VRRPSPRREPGPEEDPVHYEGQLLWDADKGEITNIPEANQWVKPTYGNGWELSL
jgi:hypothetical protein